MQLRVLGANPALFPDPTTALQQPNGLLAVGGDLSPARLRNAYAAGIFPWFSDDEPLLWWSPDPRGIFLLGDFRPGASLRRQLRRDGLTISCNRDFAAVIHECAVPRPQSPGCWITDDMIRAYCALHASGDAHSIEVWNPAGQLVGGLYGVAVGLMFCAESMFSRISNGSKLALAALRLLLQQAGAPLFDTQLLNPHLEQLGAVAVARHDYLAALSVLRQQPSPWPHHSRDLTALVAHG